MIKILGKKSTILVLTTLVITSICMGVLVDSFSINIQTITSIAEHNHHFSIYNNIVSIFLLGVVINSIFNLSISNNQINSDHNMIFISGMTCNNCVNKISNEIKLLGYENFHIDLNKGTLTINDKHVHWDIIKDKVKSMGYDINN